MAAVTPPRPLAENDDRSRFDCGRASLTTWFQQRAWSNHVSGVSRTNVICDVATGEIIGYVTLSAAQIERAFLPKPHQRNKPDPVPVTLLGQLAIHKVQHFQGYVQSLLMFALTTAVRAFHDIGRFDVRIVVLEANEIPACVRVACVLIHGAAARLSIICRYGAP